MIQILVFLPLIAALLVGLNTRRLSPAAAQWLTCVPMVISAVLAGVVFNDVVIHGNPQIVTYARWLTSGTMIVDWTLRVDSLTAVMLVVVTWVSALVHIYSVGYMGHDAHPPRFMCYLSLFTFFMLMLVTSDNFLQLFLGWEGVGLCSYLLIGFWYEKDSANNAAMKAFIVNRVGDFGFALGIFAIFLVFGTIQFSEVFEKAHLFVGHELDFLGMKFDTLTLICILLFIGAMGKSAQLGLHTWLPDAMEGPTPVSALIHAATMVTAGVFMVARCSPLFELSETALAVVTVIGACTCLFAATVALTQNDIKRVIAYSTCSQLGYMFFACGVGAYAAGVFHLATHGFFKALLFLGAGSVIHAMSDEQDMRKMGGIWRKIPFTYAMMLIGTLAITGFPMLAGYYSKDLVLESAYAAGAHGNRYGAFAFWMGIAAATLTAFYSWRLMFLTFHGKCRASKKVQEHVHESPAVMTIPLLLLSLGALFAGYIGAEKLHIGGADLKFWNGAITMKGATSEAETSAETSESSHDATTEEAAVTEKSETEAEEVSASAQEEADHETAVAGHGEEHGDAHGTYNVLEAAHHVPSWVKRLPFVVGIIGFALALICYLLLPSIPGKVANTLRPLYLFLLNKWYFDELYDFLFVRPTKWLGRFLWQKGDMGTIDRFGPDGLSALCMKLGKKVSALQSGYAYHYAFVMLIGMVGLISWIFYLNAVR